MPSDIHDLTGPRKYYDDLRLAWADVWKIYPGATLEGSVGSWSATKDGQLVAEAWMHPRRPGWWVRIKVSEI